MAQVDKDLKDLKDKTEKYIKNEGLRPRALVPMVAPVSLPRIGRDGCLIFKKGKK